MKEKIIEKLRSLHIKHVGIYVGIIMFLLAFVLPGLGDSQTVQTILTVLGILFGIIVGFYITALYSRFERIRENVAIEVSSWARIYSFSKILGNYPRNKKWFNELVELIDAYLIKWIDQEWETYQETDPEFLKVNDHFLKLKEIKTIKESEAYANVLATLNGLSEAREKLIMLGKSKLKALEWSTVIILAFTLIFSLFFLKTPEVTSIVFTGLLSSVVVILLFVLRDLNDITSGEDMISFEPYEEVFDTIGKSRYYTKAAIKRGAVQPREGIKYRTD